MHEPEADEHFKGFCFPIKDDLWHTPAVDLNNCDEAVRYAYLQKGIFYEVRVVDMQDRIVIHAIDGKIVFPVVEVPA